MPRAVPPPDHRASTPHFRSGDPIRALASIGVVVVHAATSALYVSGHFQEYLDHGLSGTLGPLGAVVGAGVVGVPVFFVLSGFLISRPFVAAYVDGRPLPRVGAYLWNRAVRLFPAFWVALAIALVVAGTAARTGTDLGRLATVSQSWSETPLRFYLGQAWTLDVEARFYLMVPAAGILIMLAARAAGGRPHHRGGRLLLLAVLAAAAALMCFFTVSRTGESQYYRAIAQAHVLLAGVLLAIADLALVGRRCTSPWLPRAGAAVIAVTLGVLVWISTEDPWVLRVLPLDDAHRGLAVLTLCGLLIVGVPALLERLGAGSWSALDNRVLRWLGGRAYGLYLYHFMLLTTFSHHLPTPDHYRWGTVILVVTALPLSLVAAELSWRLVEAPALRLKRAASRPAAKTAAALRPLEVTATAPRVGAT